ncbi:MAG: hypothetical protein ACRDG7_05685 [Candidatus Limnocylindria bacterium]
MAALCAGVALLAGIASALGVFARGDGTVETVVNARGVAYEMITDGVYAYNGQRLVAEGIGWDVFTLFVAVPALLVATLFVARGSFRGRLFALGLLGYFFYQYLEYAVTWAFGPLFLLFVVIYAASLAGMVWIGIGLAREGVAGRFSERFPRRRWAVLNVVMASLLTLLWLQRIATALAGDLVAGRLTSETTMTVQALDLGLIVPTSVCIAVLAWRRSPAGYALAAAYAVTFVAMASAIVGMLLSAWAVEGTLAVPPVAIFGLAAAAAVALGARMYGSVVPGVDDSPPAAAQAAPAAA